VLSSPAHRSCLLRTDKSRQQTPSVARARNYAQPAAPGSAAIAERSADTLCPLSGYPRTSRSSSLQNRAQNLNQARRWLRYRSIFPRIFCSIQWCQLQHLNFRTMSFPSRLFFESELKVLINRKTHAPSKIPGYRQILYIKQYFSEEKKSPWIPHFEKYTVSLTSKYRK